MLPGMWKPADALVLTAEQRELLEALARSGQTPQRVAARALIVSQQPRGARSTGLPRSSASVGRPSICGAIGFNKPACWAW